MFENNFLNKFVKIKQKDGFYKTGKVVQILPDAIILRFVDGREVTILIEFISTTEVVV